MQYKFWVIIGLKIQYCGSKIDITEIRAVFLSLSLSQVFRFPLTNFDYLHLRHVQKNVDLHDFLKGLFIGAF